MCTFHYFMVLIDASTRWSYVCLLSIRNVSFARLLTQMTKSRAQFPDYPIKIIRLDNAMSIGINIKHLAAHVHTQNGLAKSLIKRL